MKRFISAALLISLLAGTNSASALTLSSVEGTWDNAIGGLDVTFPSDVPVLYGNKSEDQVRWGTDVGNGKSGLGFTGAASDSTFNIGDPFAVGQLRHFNNSVALGSSSSAVDLTINLSFSNPSGLENSFLFTFGINETPNSPDPVDDFIFFPSSFPCETCVIGGTQYTLQLLGFGPNPDQLQDQFQSPEGSINSTLLWGRITSPIPAPGALLLGAMGTGLIGWLRRRRAL